MPIDVFASMPHYVDHLAPVAAALARRRALGAFIVSPGAVDYARSKFPKAVASDDEAWAGRDGVPILVAASGNLFHARKRGREHRAIMEHGAGFSFGGTLLGAGIVAATSPSYAGGDRRPASLFLHPGEHPAARDRAKYPRARVDVVGCPKLDTLPKRRPGGPPTVAFSFHWDTTLAPETRSAFLYYREHLASLAAEGRKSGAFTVVGHGHPRLIERVGPWYERKGIEVLRTFDEVCERADVYACDASSTIYEFASTGRPVVVLNAPYYRRDVNHGLRFETSRGCPITGGPHFCGAAHVGEQVDEPYDVGAAVRRALAAPDRLRDQRESALNIVYAFRTGAAARAASSLLDWSAGVA